MIRQGDLMAEPDGSWQQPRWIFLGPEGLLLYRHTQLYASLTSNILDIQPYAAGKSGTWAHAFQQYGPRYHSSQACKFCTELQQR